MVQPRDPGQEAQRARDGVMPDGARGRLKVYLGAVAGSGKTFAMLHEGHDRRSLGEDVVVGFVETHGRRRTAEAVGSLEVIPRLTVDYRGAKLDEMDLAAVLARRPQIALVDELAHTNVPGLDHDKRWQDIDELLDNGIDVITTLNVQHLESVKDVVERITGIAIRETVPDRVLNQAGDIRFIDITPEALRKRMLHGNVYPKERIDAALDNFFRPGNLAALRELGLRFVADHIGAGGVERQPEDVLVAVSGDGGSAHLIRRAVRIARRYRGFCSVLHVTGPACNHTDDWRDVAELLECPVIEVAGDGNGSVVAAIVEAAHARNACHVVIGESSHHSPGFFRRGIVDRLVAALDDCDLHVFSRYALLQAKDQRPDADQILRTMQTPALPGRLRIYLGYAPGCGTSTAILAEAVRRHSRGGDVVVAVAPTSGELLPDLPVLGGLQGPAGRGQLDVQAVLARNPEVCCVDDLAGQTTTGEPIAAAVPSLLAAGIVVLGAVCLADLAAVAEAVPAVAEDESRHRLDDAILAMADEVELIDVTPADLLDRLRKGNVIPLSKVASALQGMYRPEVLQLLRELAFRRMSALSDRRLLDYMNRASITSPWEARPRILVCITPNEGADELIHGAAGLAARRSDPFTVLSVRTGEQTDAEKLLLGEYAALTHKLDGEFVSLYDGDVVGAIARYARENRITEIVVQREKKRGSRSLSALIDALADVDVHILAAVG